MDFSKKYLQKYGWEEGQGLGKYKSGIKKPLTLKLKLNKLGVGCSPSADFTDTWWNEIYNDALANAKISPKLKQSSTVDTVQKSSIESDTLKKGCLVGDQKQEANISWDLDELYKACGGRTVHKGARHGLQLSGKLERLQQQEKTLLSTRPNTLFCDNRNNSKILVPDNNKTTCSSKKKKKKFVKIK